MTNPTKESAAWRALARWYAANEGNITLHILTALIYVDHGAPRRVFKRMYERFLAYTQPGYYTNRELSLACLWLAHEAEEEGE